MARGPDTSAVEVGSRHLLGGVRPGSYVELGLVDVGQVAPRPDGRPGPTAYPSSFTPEQAAGFGYAPVAYHTLKVAAALQAGETVLFHAAAGGTGVLAVQLAKAAGARVLATAGSPEKLELARQLGARSLFAERVDGQLQFRRGFSIAEGERVLIAEDIVTTGLSFRETVEALDKLPGEVVGGACIIDRSNGRADVGCKLVSLAAVDFPDYDANDLPPDLAAIEAVKPGSRGLA